MRLAAPRRARRGTALTPMVDVVFLLVFFFMLASRFGTDLGLPVALGGDGTDWTGPPRLVEVGAGSVRLNGVETPVTDLAEALDRLMSARSEPVVIAPLAGADTGAYVAVLSGLQAAGFSALVVAQ